MTISEDDMTFDTPITAAAKRMTMLLETGYLPEAMSRDIKILMQGAMAFEVVTRPDNKPPRS